MPEQNKYQNIPYRKVGDYYLPNLSVPEGRPLRRWGRMRRDYLREHRPAEWNAYLTSGTLWEHLNAIDDEADDRLYLLIDQMKKAEGITEELKMTNQMAWVGRMNNIRSRAEEIIIHEMICC